MRERVEAMKAIWTQEEASYHGEHVNFERIWSHPKPAQRPHPPVLVGGDGPGVLDRVLAFGDGWLPNYHRRRGSSSASRSCARAPSARSTSTCFMPADAARARARRGRRRAPRAPLAAVRRPQHRRGRARALGGRDRRAHRRVSAERRRARASPRARVARLATADARGAPAPRADHLRARRRDDLQRGRRREAQAHAGAARGSPTSPPTRASRVLADHYEEDWERAVVGARRRPRARARPRRPPRPRAALHALADRYRALPRTRRRRAAARDRRRALVRLVGVG